MPRGDVQDHMQQLHQVQARLAKRPWFADHWRTEAYTWPTDKPPEYAMLQLTKTSWLNEQRQGIHLETWVGPEEAKTGSLPIELHILHVNEFPGTRLKRATLTRPLMERMGRIAASWDGYETSRNTMRPVRGRVSFRKEGIETVLVREFERLQILGPVIDEILKHIVHR